MESVFQISSIKTLLEQGLNCWLQYALAQPIYLDLQIMAVLSFQSLGITKIIEGIRGLSTKLEFLQNPLKDLLVQNI
jgi:hypothetical protein